MRRSGERRLTDPTPAARPVAAGPTPSSRPALLRSGLHPGKPPERKLDRGEAYEGGQGFGEVLEILGEAISLTTERECGWDGKRLTVAVTAAAPFTRSIGPRRARCHCGNATAPFAPNTGPLISGGRKRRFSVAIPRPSANTNSAPARPSSTDVRAAAFWCSSRASSQAMSTRS
jgi:hypothetical protein